MKMLDLSFYSQIIIIFEIDNLIIFFSSVLIFFLFPLLCLFLCLFSSPFFFLFFFPWFSPSLPPSFSFSFIFIVFFLAHSPYFELFTMRKTVPVHTLTQYLSVNLGNYLHYFYFQCLEYGEVPAGLLTIALVLCIERWFFFFFHIFVNQIKDKIKHIEIIKIHFVVFMSLYFEQFMAVFDGIIHNC